MAQENEMDVSQLVAPSSSATVHGVFVGAVSPVKTSRKNSSVKYFESQLCDGKKTVCVVSFELKFRNEIEDAKKGQYGVAVKNCCIKRSRMADNDEFEIIAGHKTSILKSPKKFRIKEAITTMSCPNLGSLEDLKDSAENQKLNIIGKIVSISPPEKLRSKGSGNELQKQDFVIGDCTATCRGVLWEQQVDTLEINQSYKMLQVTVRSFNGRKYFSLGEKCEIEKIEDIGEIVDDDLDNGNGGAVVVKGEIVAVIGIDSYRSCRNCNAKVSTVNEFMGECNKCNAKIKLSRCGEKNVARVIIEDATGKEYKLSIFDEILDHIIEHGKTAMATSASCITKPELLLSAPQLLYTITSKETVSSVSMCVKGTL